MKDGQSSNFTMEDQNRLDSMQTHHLLLRWNVY